MNLNTSRIAMFIAAALQHPNPPCNGSNRRISTIHVDQHKSKFGSVVVYCRLADPNEVAAAWNEMGPLGDPSPGFRQQCLLQDAILYRSVYRSMFALVQDKMSWDTLVGGAPYSYLLHLTLDEVPFSQLFPEVFKEWDVRDSHELKARLEEVYRHDQPLYV